MLRIGTDTVAFNANNPEHSITWNYDVVKKVETVPGRNEGWYYAGVIRSCSI